MSEKETQAAALVEHLPQLVPVEDAAAFLHCSKRTIRAYIRTGRLRAIRPVPGGTSRVLVLRSSIAALIARAMGDAA